MIDGKTIGQMSTIGGIYSNGNIEVWINNERHLLHVREIDKMVSHFYFEVEQKYKIKHLKNPIIKKAEIQEIDKEWLSGICGEHTTDIIQLIEKYLNGEIEG